MKSSANTRFLLLKLTIASSAILLMQMPGVYPAGLSIHYGNAHNGISIDHHNKHGAVGQVTVNRHPSRHHSRQRSSNYTTVHHITIRTSTIHTRLIVPIFHLHTANITLIAHLPNIITTRATHARTLTPDTLIHIEVIPIINKAVLVTTGNNILQEIHGMPCSRVKNIQQFCNLELKRKLIQSGFT
jgi:hypothetical protein